MLPPSYSQYWHSCLYPQLLFRLPVDYEEDLEVAKRVFNTIYESNPDFSFYDLAEFLDKNKDITAINQQRIGINWYNKHLDELKNDPGRHF